MPSYPIVGSYYRPPAKAILSALPVETKLTLRPEPENKIDRNAIAVWIQTCEIPEASHNQIQLSGGDSGFRVGDERAESFEHYLELILSEPEWHLGYIPAVIAKTIHLPREISAKLVFSIEGKPFVERSEIREIEIEENE